MVNICTVLGTDPNCHLMINTHEDDTYNLCISVMKSGGYGYSSISTSKAELIKLYQNLRDWFIPQMAITLEDGSNMLVPVPDDEIEETDAKFEEALKRTTERYGEAFKRMPKD